MFYCHVKVAESYCCTTVFCCVNFNFKTIMGGESLKEQAEKQKSLIFEKDRLQTFSKNWKELGFRYCTPENFAAAGFYNLNTSTSITDTVKCFACQKELSDWEEDDDPWQEHIKRGSKCPFVIFKKKENPTVQDFLELQFETKKIILLNNFDQEKQTLQEQEKVLLKKINELKKLKK